MSISSSIQIRQQRFRRGAAVGIVLFILTQFAFIVHETQHLVHKPGEVCQICIQASHSGNAVPATVVVVPVVLRNTPAADQVPVEPVITFFFGLFSIRAPPSILS
jgi:hypothetical protein